jgi:hypothetical protein
VNVEPLACLNCGAVWHSAPAARAAAANGGCLVCGGKLVPVSERERRQGPERGASGDSEAGATDD